MRKFRMTLSSDRARTRDENDSAPLKRRSKDARSPEALDSECTHVHSLHAVLPVDLAPRAASEESSIEGYRDSWDRKPSARTAPPRIRSVW